MAETKKKAKSKKKRGKYEQKLSVNGSFLDVVKASVEEANSKKAEKKS